MSDYVFALCPTFRHPKLLSNSLALWKLQKYQKRHLLILDDGNTFSSQYGSDWSLISVDNRFPSITAKYNYMLSLVPSGCDIICVWEDDDIYLPDYISSHVNALRTAEFSHPDVVLSDYGGTIHREQAAGRFHSSIAVRKDLLLSVGGWPNTKRADFDQQLISLLAKSCKNKASPWPSDAPDDSIHFIYRWHTGYAHCQSAMTSPDDETWYDRLVHIYEPVSRVGLLKPELDVFTKNVLLQRELL